MFKTVCTRCGKEGILFKKWVERPETGRGNPMTRELYVCPDSDCQKIVDEKFAQMRQKKLDLKEKKNDLAARRTV